MALFQQRIKNSGAVIDTNIQRKCQFVNSPFEFNAQKMNAWINIKMQKKHLCKGKISCRILSCFQNKVNAMKRLLKTASECRLEICKSSISSDRVCVELAKQDGSYSAFWHRGQAVQPGSHPLDVSFPLLKGEANIQTTFGNSPWLCKQPWVGAQDPAVFPSPGELREVHFRCKSSLQK